ncbi:hypothetical protein LTR66_003671 [Elasticomyces elasticus]|nr:hypothetical protein LTR66_003671 [Elasticomyces elasticus]
MPYNTPSTSQSTSAGSPSDGANNEAGASGSDAGAFHMSNGVTAAIISVVVIVAVFGGKSSHLETLITPPQTASAILYILAKRRHWNVRASIARASRRLTGRFDGSARNNRQNRNTTVRMNSPQRHQRSAYSRPDVEKGGVKATVVAADGSRFEGETPKIGGWVSKILGKR